MKVTRSVTIPFGNASVAQIDYEYNDDTDTYTVAISGGLLRSDEVGNLATILAAIPRYERERA